LHCKAKKPLPGNDANGYSVSGWKLRPVPQAVMVHHHRPQVTVPHHHQRHKPHLHKPHLRPMELLLRLRPHLHMAIKINCRPKLLNLNVALVIKDLLDHQDHQVDLERTERTVVTVRTATLVKMVPLLNHQARLLSSV